MKEVKEARNDEAHRGAAARAAARIATVVGIYLEDALMAASGAEKDGVKAYIQTEVVRAYKWQRLGECRRLMLTLSFSYLPLKIGNEWKMLADADLAKYLADTDEKRRKERVKETVKEAKKNGLKVKKSAIVEPNDSKEEALNKMEGKAAIVKIGEDLVGIITPFDLL